MHQKPESHQAGADSSGKSSIMQPLLLLKQTLDAPFDPGPLWLDGPTGGSRLPTSCFPDQLLSRIEGRRKSDAFEVELQFQGQPSMNLRFRQTEEQGFQLDQMIYGDTALSL